VIGQIGRPEARFNHCHKIESGGKRQTGNRASKGRSAKNQGHSGKRDSVKRGERGGNKIRGMRRVGTDTRKGAKENFIAKIRGEEYWFVDVKTIVGKPGLWGSEQSPSGLKVGFSRCIWRQERRER